MYLNLCPAASSHPYILLSWCVVCSHCLFFCLRLFAWTSCFYMYTFGPFRFLDCFYDGDLHLPWQHAISNSFLMAKLLSSCSKSFALTWKLGAAQCCWKDETSRLSQTSLPVISQKQTIHVVQRGRRVLDIKRCLHCCHIVWQCRHNGYGSWVKSTLLLTYLYDHFYITNNLGLRKRLQGSSHRDGCMTAYLFVLLF